MTANQPNHSGDQALFTYDMRDEGEPEAEFHAGIAQRLPRKSIASGALILDDSGRILFIYPTYKPLLEIPGGLTEGDESPLSACEREIQEELGIEVSVGRLLLVDWMPTHGVWQDSIQMIFDGGTLDEEQINRIQAAPDEVHRFEFLDVHEAKDRLRPSMARRVQLAHRVLLDNTTVYGEFGRVTSAPCREGAEQRHPQAGLLGAVHQSIFPPVGRSPEPPLQRASGDCRLRRDNPCACRTSPGQEPA